MKWEHFNLDVMRKTVVHCIVYGIVLLFFFSCSPKDDVLVLQWHKAYKTDSLEKNLTGLKWCFTYLGATFASDSIVPGLKTTETTIRIQLDRLGLPENAQKHLRILHAQCKETEEYQKNGGIDIGRYIALTIGSSYNYYKIAAVPEQLENFRSAYSFESVQGYIDNSSISNVDRVISFAKGKSEGQYAFISAETDSVSKEVLEFETLEILPNGLMRFGIYDRQGYLKDAADPAVTRAGKPAKCMWCHETAILPLFRDQKNHPGYLSYAVFKDSLVAFNRKFRTYQESLWQEAAIKNRRLHTEMELSYISFMEPSAVRIAEEWNIPVSEVEQKLKHLPTHRHEEFDYLGNLYHRGAIDALAPYTTMEVPENIREKSANEVHNFTYRSYVDHFLNSASLSASEKK